MPKILLDLVDPLAVTVVYTVQCTVKLLGSFTIYFLHKKC